MSIPDSTYAQFPNQNCVQDVKEYLEHGHLIEEYLAAFVMSDIKALGIHFDSTNWDMIFRWVQWFHMHAPSNSWGSELNVNAWCAHNGLKGLEEQMR